MTILGYAVTDLFLYFIFYSFLGWVMETCYCSICERRLVPRGFLYGPICPIYGAGAGNISWPGCWRPPPT